MNALHLLQMVWAPNKQMNTNIWEDSVPAKSLMTDQILIREFIKLGPLLRDGILCFWRPLLSSAPHL